MLTQSLPRSTRRPITVPRSGCVGLAEESASTDDSQRADSAVMVVDNPTNLHAVAELRRRWRRAFPCSSRRTDRNRPASDAACMLGLASVFLNVDPSCGLVDDFSAEQPGLSRASDERQVRDTASAMIASPGDLNLAADEQPVGECGRPGIEHGSGRDQRESLSLLLAFGEHVDRFFRLGNQCATNRGSGRLFFRAIGRVHRAGVKRRPTIIRAMGG